MSTWIIFEQMVMIFLLIMSGYVMAKRGLFPDGSAKGISALVVNVCNPALLLVGCLHRDPSITNHTIINAIIASGVLYLALAVSGVFYTKIRKSQGNEKKFYQLMCMFGNNGFIGIPLVSATVGTQALIYVAIVNLYFNILVYTYGYSMLSNEKTFKWKKMINTGNAACILAIILFLFPVKVPVLIESTLTYMGNATTILAMVVIGISLSTIELKELVTDRKLYTFIGYRFIVIPIILAQLFRLLIKNNDLYYTMLLLAAVPVANMPLMIAQEQGIESRFLSKGIILSTVLSIVTIPFVFIFQ